jgi:hypothetical protein
MKRFCSGGKSFLPKLLEKEQKGGSRRATNGATKNSLVISYWLPAA